MTTPWTCWRDPSHKAINTTEFGWPQCALCSAAPPYHERPSYLPDNFAMHIYVPTGLAASVIARGSGVVGMGGETRERVTVYYEGWINGAMQYEDRDARGKWEAGVEHAASRMITAYPTIALASLRTDDLLLVGVYYPKERRIFVGDETTLEDWLT